MVSLLTNDGPISTSKYVYRLVAIDFIIMVVPSGLANEE